MKQAQVAVVLLLLAVSTFADDIVAIVPVPGAGGGVTGVVTTVSGNLITVLNGSVAIDATGANFHGRKGVATIADVKPGLRIVATVRNADAGPGTTLQASDVVILDSPSGNLTGRVQVIDLAGSSLTVLGVRVQVTAETRINAFTRGSSGRLSDIKVGDNVYVEVNTTGSALVAEMINVFPPIPNASIEGTVKSIGATSWVITTARNGDVTVTVNSNTYIDPSAKVGDVVRVSGNADASGHITALAINVANIVRPPVDAPLQGVVKSITATSWVITTRDGKDVTVGIASDTKFDSSIKVGDNVRVLTRTDAAGNVIAILIVKAEGPKQRAA